MTRALSAILLVLAGWPSMSRLPPGWGGADAVHRPADGPAVLVVHAREDVVIAEATAALVGA